MRAALLTSLNSPLIISELDLTPLKTGQVLVRVLMSGICGTQLKEINGSKGNKKFLPHLIGHEGCGIVLDIGPGVSNVAIGDKVVMHWRKGLGIDSEFPMYIHKGKSITSGKINTLTEQAIVSENRLTSVPHKTSDLLCTLLGCSLSTALGTIENEANLKFGETIVIIGCGGVGLNLVKSASIGGAALIVAVDIAPNKLESALQAGADYYVDLSDKNLENAFEKLPNNKSDVIIDTTGEIKLIRQAFNYLSENGRLILVSQPEIGAEVVIDSLSNMFGSEGKKIIFTQGGKFAPEKDILRYINLFQRKDLDVSFLSTKRFQLSEINKGIEVLKNGLTGRVIIEMSEGNL